MKDVLVIDVSGKPQNLSSHRTLRLRTKSVLTENDEFVKTDKKTAEYLNEFFSSVVQNIDITRYEIKGFFEVFVK